MINHWGHWTYFCFNNFLNNFNIVKLKITKKKHFFLVFIPYFLLSNFSAFTQTETMRVNLKEVVQMAQGEGPGVRIAKTKLTTNYWLYQSFLADYKPEISVVGELPQLNRSIREITLPNGEQSFASSAFMNNSLGVQLSQDIALTGGSIFASTGIERLDIFRTSTAPRSTSYLSSPIVIGFNQPFFGYNQLKWNKKIEPLRYDEAIREYSEEMEMVAFDAAEIFFDVYFAQINLEAAERNKINADTLFAISKGRYSVGRIAETELLQIELGSMNSDTELAEATLNLQSNSEALRNFLGIKKAIKFDLITPNDIPNFSVDPELALKYALKNRSKTIEFQRRLAESEAAVAQAKGQNGRNINLFGRFGLTQTASSLGDAFSDPKDQEQLTLGIQIPIADWGKAKSRMEIARSNQELEQMNIEQERISFEQGILLRVNQFDLVRRQVALGTRAYEVAKKRENITRKRYLIGKIGISDLNLAIRELNEARRNYMVTLRSFWLAYYELRNLTLYNFEKEEHLIREVER